MMRFLQYFRRFLFFLFSLYSYVAYSFVGGARGSFSGSRGHGCCYEGTTGSLRGTLIFCSIILFFMVLFYLYSQTTLAKRINLFRQKIYIKRCKHSSLYSKKAYSCEARQLALAQLKYITFNQVKDLKLSESYLNTQAINAFIALQSAWSRMNERELLQSCSNSLFSSKLCRQMIKMKKLDIYNHIAETEIKECHLIHSFIPRWRNEQVFRFALSGMQIDEYLPKHTTISKTSPLPFNCLLDVLAYSSGFKVYEIKFQYHIRCEPWIAEG